MPISDSGIFITLEGGEGAGKTSLMKVLAEKISAKWPDRLLVTTREPGQSSIGREVRNILLNGDHVEPRAEALLFAADRAQHVHEVIAPALYEDGIVLCDRFVPSSLAYQGIARNLGEKEVRALSDFATQELEPDLVFILDLDPEVGLSRKQQQKELNNMELEDMSFHKRVRDAFLDLAEANGYVVIDASASPHDVAAEVWQHIINFIETP